MQKVYGSSLERRVDDRALWHAIKEAYPAVNLEELMMVMKIMMMIMIVPFRLRKCQESRVR